jgi:hypothetical protein
MSIHDRPILFGVTVAELEGKAAALVTSVSIVSYAPFAFNDLPVVPFG